jgi:large subunit ribosomal protein L25
MEDVEVVLKAKAREVIGKQVKALRRGGALPAVIYGRGIESIPIALDYHEASLVLPGVTSSQFIIIDVEGNPHTTLVRERQRHPVTGNLLHVDFQEISMTETLRTAVGLDLKGEAPAIASYGGILVTGVEELMVECLPTDLPERLEVDLSSLEEIGDAIYVGDIQAPPRVKILADPEDMIALITAPEAEPLEEEEEVEEIEIEGEEPEVIERGKREEDEDF